MNTNIVPFTILDVSKVFSWPHNHLIHWSYMIASISIYIKSTFHVTTYKNGMKFHMLMFKNAWMMLVLIKCRWQMQCLTLRCYTLVSLLSEKATAASIRRVEEWKSAEHTPQHVKQRKRRARNLSRFYGTQPVILKPVIRGSNMVGLSQNLTSSFLA